MERHSVCGRSSVLLRHGLRDTARAEKESAGKSTFCSTRWTVVFLARGTALSRAAYPRRPASLADSGCHHFACAGELALADEPRPRCLCVDCSYLLPRILVPKIAQMIPSRRDDAIPALLYSVVRCFNLAVFCASTQLHPGNRRGSAHARPRDSSRRRFPAQKRRQVSGSCLPRALRKAFRA